MSNEQEGQSAMKVIGAGFPRTGTSTQRQALMQLGFVPCYDMQEIAENSDLAEGWVNAFSGEPIDLRATFAGYQATTDLPGCFFWRELMEEYPDAKVVLSVRDPHKWYESMRNTVLRTELFEESAHTLANIEEWEDFDRGPRRLAPVMFDRIFGERRDEQHLTEVFNRHNAEVQRDVPADRLLVFEVSQGWEPLCEFLGVDVPDEPFPRLNGSAEFVERIQEFRRQLGSK